MAEFPLWAIDVLTPTAVYPNVVPFTRSGGRTLGGLEPVTRTDRGYWRIEYRDIPVHNARQYRTWRAIRQHLSGRAGLIRVPLWSRARPLPAGVSPPVLTTFGDGATFSDTARFSQGAIAVECAETVAIGATSIKLRILAAEADLVGVHFSYRDALYETGPLIDVAGSVWTVPMSPAVRAEIPAGSLLEFDRPTCLCRLSDDRGMDIGETMRGLDRPSVSFVEAVDHWSNLAAGLL